MAKTLVEKAVCEACGSDVREGSSFCYNCGEAVITGPPPPAILKPDPGLLNGRGARATDKLVFDDPEPAPIEAPRERLEKPPPVSADAEKLRTASALKRKTRVRSKKTSEVEWVEPSTSSVGFIITAVLLAVFAGLMLLAAMYLR